MMKKIIIFLVVILGVWAAVVAQDVGMDKGSSMGETQKEWKSYNSSVQLDLGYSLGVSYEYVVLKRNALIFCVGYNHLNSIDGSNQIGENQYRIRVPQGQVVNVDNMGNLKEFDYLDNGDVYDGWFNHVRMDQSFLLTYGDFLPRYSVPVNATFRSYFWVKPSVVFRPFCEVGVKLNVINGYQITTMTSIEYENSENESAEYRILEQVSLGERAFRLDTDLHLGLGFRLRVFSKYFMEMKVSQLPRLYAQKSATWTKDTQEIRGRPFSNFSMGIGLFL